MTQNSSEKTAPDATPGTGSGDPAPRAEAPGETAPRPDIHVGPEDTLNFNAGGAPDIGDGGFGPADPGTTDAPADTPDPAARIADLEAEVARLNREYLGALAEAQNAKRMADKRIQDNTKYAVSNLAKAVLTVADNLERALAAAPADARETDPNLNNLAVGVEMTAKELAGALAQYGIRRIEAQDQPFDPNLHQAMQEVENREVPAGTVVQVFQNGYLIHDRLLRPAMVVVSRGGPKRTPAPAAGEGGESTGGGGGGNGGRHVDTSA